mmetsp:Transcript_19463/g.51091  ORF Transcript_19463/g.51091 Transcript_19463/m.51091 type:complete len:327 (-) Transcript_19463:14-994(-)
MSELFSDNPGLPVEHISDRSVAVLDRDRLARQPAAGRIFRASFLQAQSDRLGLAPRRRRPEDSGPRLIRCLLVEPNRTLVLKNNFEYFGITAETRHHGRRRAVLVTVVVVSAVVQQKLATLGASVGGRGMERVQAALVGLAHHVLAALRLHVVQQLLEDGCEALRRRHAHRRVAAPVRGGNQSPVLDEHAAHIRVALAAGGDQRSVARAARNQRRTTPREQCVEDGQVAVASRQPKRREAHAIRQIERGLDPLMCQQQLDHPHVAAARRRAKSVVASRILRHSVSPVLEELLNFGRILQETGLYEDCLAGFLSERVSHTQYRPPQV